MAETLTAARFMRAHPIGRAKKPMFCKRCRWGKLKIMEEIQNITEKYDAAYIERELSTLKGLNNFSLIFYKDVAEIYDCLTRVKNIERNTVGFSIDDAPILGLLVKVWKLLKEVIRYYEEDNAETISILERPFIEAAVTTTYLMISPPEIMADY